MMSKDQYYLVRGAVLRCDCGSASRKLNLPMCHGVYILNQPMMNADDYKANVNIMHFGMCSETGGKCEPQIFEPWFKAHKKTLVDGVPAITTDSFIVCGKGGLIEPKTSGQEMSNTLLSASGLLISKATEMAMEASLVGPRSWLNGAIKGAIPNQAIVGSGKAKTIDGAGLNFIANLERNLSTINYNNGIITGIPQKGNDVGYGHDISVNPLGYTPSNPLSASDALKLLIDDTTKITDKFAEDINVSFTQQQLNALVAIRYNCGALSQFDGLLPMLERGNYNRNEFADIINNYYIRLATNNPDEYAQYLDGWLNRTEKMMDVFLNGDYGYVSIDAVNGKVVR